MRRKVVVSFFDFTGEAVRPWAEAGYECLCLDLQHKAVRTEYVGAGLIRFIPWDATNNDHRRLVCRMVEARTVAMVFGWPPCTDLAASGARHWAAKRAKDPDFQTKAVDMAKLVEALAWLWDAPCMIENPQGALCTLWRKPDHRFDPCDFGGYLSADEPHPRWPRAAG